MCKLSQLLKRTPSLTIGIPICLSKKVLYSCGLLVLACILVGSCTDSIRANCTASPRGTHGVTSRLCRTPDRISIGFFYIHDSSCYPSPGELAEEPWAWPRQLRRTPRPAGIRSAPAVWVAALRRLKMHSDRIGPCDEHGPWPASRVTPGPGDVSPYTTVQHQIEY